MDGNPPVDDYETMDGDLMGGELLSDDWSRNGFPILHCTIL